MAFSVSKWSSVRQQESSDSECPNSLATLPLICALCLALFEYTCKPEVKRNHYAVRSGQCLRRWSTQEEDKTWYPKQYISWVPGGKLQDNKSETNFKETMTGNFLKWMKDLVIRYKSPENSKQYKWKKKKYWKKWWGKSRIHIHKKNI